MQEIGIRACRARWRRCSLISAGPVAQFSPISVDAERLQRGQRGADLACRAACVPVVSTVTCAMTGSVDAGRGDGPLGADDRRLGLQQVLRGLDQHRVDAAGEQPGDLRLVGVAQRRVGDVPEGRQLGARARPSRAPSAAGPAVDQPSATSRASRAPASASS